MNKFKLNKEELTRIVKYVYRDRGIFNNLAQLLSMCEYDDATLIDAIIKDSKPTIHHIELIKCINSVTSDQFNMIIKNTVVVTFFNIIDLHSKLIDDGSGVDIALLMRKFMYAIDNNNRSCIETLFRRMFNRSYGYDLESLRFDMANNCKNIYSTLTLLEYINDDVLINDFKSVNNVSMIAEGILSLITDGYMVNDEDNDVIEYASDMYIEMSYLSKLYKLGYIDKDYYDKCIDLAAERISDVGYSPYYDSDEQPINIIDIETLASKVYDLSKDKDIVNIVQHMMYIHRITGYNYFEDKCDLLYDIVTNNGNILHVHCDMFVGLSKDKVLNIMTHYGTCESIKSLLDNNNVVLDEEDRESLYDYVLNMYSNDDPHSCLLLNLSMIVLAKYIDNGSRVSNAYDFIINYINCDINNLITAGVVDPSVGNYLVSLVK